MRRVPASKQAPVGNDTMHGRRPSTEESEPDKDAGRDEGREGGRGQTHEYVQADTKSSGAGREQAIRERCTGVSMWCDARVSIDVCVHGDARGGRPRASEGG